MLLCACALVHAKRSSLSWRARAAQTLAATCCRPPLFVSFFGFYRWSAAEHEYGCAIARVACDRSGRADPGLTSRRSVQLTILTYGMCCCSLN